MTYRNVVVGTDGSATAERAVEHAAGLANAFGARLTIVTAYAPDVRMGSRQRWGVVEDMWDTAVRLARGAAGESVGAEPTRVSCCFIYAIPGMRECAACPRSGRGHVGVPGRQN